MHLILIGYMAAGKTTLGRKLAQYLNRPFIDLDQWIEAQAGLSISQIFDQYGEELFRNLERKAIQNLNQLPTAHVVATGGGLPCQGDNINKLKDSGMVIYLRPSFEVLLARLQAMRSQRPLLKDVSAETLPDFIEKMLHQREPYYRQAHHTLELDTLELLPMIKQLEKLQLLP